MKNSFKIADFAIIVAFAAVIVLSFCSIKKNKGKSRLYIKTPYDSYIYPLDKDGDFKIRGKIGYSEIFIRDGKAGFADSPCPNKTCVECPPVSRNGEWAACLPNGIFIEIEADDSDFDVVGF